MATNGTFPVFPIDNGSNGLTKREYFAALALQGLLTNPNTDTENLPEVSEWAVYHADALIKALNTIEEE